MMRLGIFLLAMFAVAAQGQAVLPVSVRFAATEANAPPGSCGCFFLKGAAADTAVTFLPRLSAVVEVAGNTVDHVAGTTRGLSTITLLAGPRYTLPVARLSVSAQTIFGAVRGFDADFIVGAKHADTATAFAMALGGFAEFRLTHDLALRFAQIDFVQTNLPNGADGRQRNVRFGAGVTFRVPLPMSRR